MAWGRGLEKLLAFAQKRSPAYFIALDYGLFLPLMARLPTRWGRVLAKARGGLYAKWGRDWRNFSFNDVVHLRTQQLIEELRPTLTKAEQDQIYQSRFEHQSLEEYEAACLHVGVTRTWPVQFEGLQGVVDALTHHKRLVLVTSHFSSSILGTAFLGQLGYPVLGMSSNVVDRQEVPPSVSRTYRRKYKAMGRYLNGGEILDREGNTSRFVRFLKKGGVVVIVGDLPPEPNEEPRWAHFLGRYRGFAAGAQRLSSLMDAPLMSFVCQYESEKHVVRFSEPGQDPYEFLSSQIERDLGQWWALDVLGAYPIKDQEQKRGLGQAQAQAQAQVQTLPRESV
jgi:lauroyl/myristoyl acyltransferase